MNSMMGPPPMSMGSMGGIGPPMPGSFQSSIPPPPMPGSFQSSIPPPPTFGMSGAFSSMSSGMGMPGPQSKMNPRPVIVCEEMPNMTTIATRQMPPQPMPWQQQQMFLPGQRTGVGVNNLHPMQEQALGNIPRQRNQYALYGYGPRTTWWANPVPVPENNPGIMVNAEFPMEKHQEGRQTVYWDLSVRNQNWTHQGPWMKPFDPVFDVTDWKQKLFGEYEQAQDMVDPCAPGPWRRHVKNKDGESSVEAYYKKLHQDRDLQGMFAEDRVAEAHFKLEILNEEDLANFFANREAVMHDQLD